MVTMIAVKYGGVVIIILMVLSMTDSYDTEYEFDRISELKLVDSLLSNYDRRATPTNSIGVPTQVGCEIFIRSFGSISEKTMDYKVDLYLRQHWVDPRLNHSEIRGDLDLNDPKLVQAIWKPEVYFPNAKDSEFQYVTVPNVLVRIKPNGQILYMLRLKLIFSCMMELSKYPLDDQICTMEIASFSKTTRELILGWKGDVAVELSKEVKIPQFVLSKVETALCDNEPVIVSKTTRELILGWKGDVAVELSKEVEIPQFVLSKVETALCDNEPVIGNYSCLVAKFYLSRSIGFHMVQSYIPTIFLVMVSWVSFFMDLDSVPGRVTLGVITLFSLSSKSSWIALDSPQVSYIKAIDIWMGACTVFIFATLLEFIFVNHLWQKYGKSNRKGYKIDLAVRIDKLCRVLFPASFLLFTVFYWIYYLYF